MATLPQGKQISPDKDVNFPCTTAAFTLPPEPAGFVVLCQLAQGLSLVCGFCSSARTFAFRLPSDPSSRRRPCLWLVLLVVFIYVNTLGSRTGDFLPRRHLWIGRSPHQFTPMPGVHKRLQRIADKSGAR